MPYMLDTNTLSYVLNARPHHQAVLERAGTPCGALDMLIAAHALSLNLKLVTSNLREFARVKGLKVENWIPD